MLNTKFRENRLAGSGEDFLVVFTIYGSGGHLDHLTRISQSHFCSHYPWRPQIKFGFHWQNSFREEESLKMKSV